MRAPSPPFAAPRWLAALLLLALAAPPAAAQTATGVQIRVGTSGAADRDGAIELTTAEGSRTYPRFQIRLSEPSFGPVSLTLRRAGSTAEGSLYRVSGMQTTAFSGPLVFAANSSDWVTFEVRPADDDIHDGSQWYTLTFSAPAYYTPAARRYRGGRVSVRVTNSDNDPPPTVTLALTPSRISESGSGNAARVTATLNRRSLVPVRVAVSAAPVSPASADDFKLSRNRTLTFRVDQTASAGMVTITAVDNDVASPTRYVTVTGTATIGAAPKQVRRLRLGITDDDEAGLAVTEAASPREITTEAGGQATFRVALKSEPTADVDVAVRSSDAGEGTASPGTLTFTADDWSTPQRVTVTGVDDAAADGDQNYMVTLDPSSGGSGPGAAAGDAYYQRLASVHVPITNRDDDAAAEDPPAEEPPAKDPPPEGPPAKDPPAEEPPAKDPPAEEPPAKDPPAEEPPAKDPPPEEPPAKDPPAKDPPAEDPPVENPPAEESPTEESPAKDPSPDDPPAEERPAGDQSAGGQQERARVTLALSPATINESGANNRAAVTATLDRPAPEGFSVAVSIDAAADAAALSANRTLTFAAGATASAGTVTITAADDGVDAPDRRVAVSGRAGAAAPAGDPADVVLTIVDDEPAPQAALTLTPSMILENGGASSIRAVLSGPSSKPTTVTVAAAAAGAVATADFRLSAARTLVIPAGRTASSGAVTVTAVDNDRAAPDQRVSVSARAVNAHAVRQPARVTLTIADDDGATAVLSAGADGQARLSLSLSPAAIDESGPGNRSVVTAALSRALGERVAVVVAAVPAGAAALSANRTLTFAPGATASAGLVTLTAVDNDVADGARIVMVSGTSAGADRPARAALTIRDDEAASTAVRLSLDPPRVFEDAGPTPILLQARLNGAARAAATVVTVGLDPDDPGTAAVGEDYAAFAPVEVTIPAGAASGRGMLRLAPVNGPDSAELAETIRLAGAAPGLAVGPALTLTLVDLNLPPVADAGVSQRSRPDMRLMLDGSGSRDPEGEALSYAWAQTSGPAVTLADPTAVRPAFLTPPAGMLPMRAAAGPGLGGRALHRSAVLEFRLTVTDARGARSVGDTTMVVVEEAAAAASSAAMAPVADAGDDQTVPQGAAVTLDGSGCRGMGMLSYAWTQLRGPPVGLSGPATVFPTFAAPAGAPASTVLEFGLVVTAGGRSSAQDTVLVTVADMADAPVADAGPDQAGVGEGEEVRLDGSGSVGAHALRYAWTQLPGGPRVALSDAAAARPRFTAPADLRRMTALEFGLVVTDAVNGRSSPRDTVRITVYGVNDAPLADAGPDQDGLEGDAAVRLDGSGSRDPEGDALAFRWRQRRGPPVTLSSPASARPVFRAPAARTERTMLEFELVVADVRGRVSLPDMVRITVRAGAEARLERVMPTLLPEAARALADGRAEAVRRRLAGADRDGASAPALSGLLEEYGPQARDGAPEWKRMLADAAFALPLDPDAAGGGGVTLWGRGDYRDLDGSGRGLEWDGEAAAAHLGADRLLANGWRAGLALSWSEAKFDYADAASGSRGDWDLEMTSAQPYLGGTVGGGIDVWATAALGSGDLDVADSGLEGEAQTADADMWMAALGAQGPLHAEGGMELSLRGEGLYANFEVDGNGGLIRRHAADVSRLRLALEAAWERRLASGARLAPRLELGVRHDGGDGETGAGVELGGGAEYVLGRLTLTGGARALVANSDYDEWGADAAVTYAAAADGRGLSFRAAPSWGAARGGVRELWERGAPGLNGPAAEPDAGGRLEAELGYGLKSPFGRGLLLLELGSVLSEEGRCSGRLAGVAAPDAATRIGLELEFRGRRSGGSGYSLMLTGELRF